MHITVQDIIHIEPLKSLKLIAGAGGLDHIVSKVGILDYEFTKRGSSLYADGHWQPGEFVLTTFIYAKDNTTLIWDAIKRLRGEKTSGIAIKNVYSLEIPHEIIHYANVHHFPVFIFTDNSLFFETVIIAVNQFMTAMNDQNVIEENISTLLNAENDINTIKKKALEINYALSEKYIIAYFGLKQGIPVHNLNRLLRCSYETLGRGKSLAKYRDGFFYIRGIDSSKKQPTVDVIHELEQKTDLNPNDYHIGISEPLYFLAHFKKGLQQSYYAAIYSRVIDAAFSHYASVGVYKLLLPYVDEDFYCEYYDIIIPPIIEYDERNNTNLLETALMYEDCHGNISEVASRLCSHNNTVRYRIKKLAEIIGMDVADGHFAEQLSLGVKLYRIRRAKNNVSD